MSVAQLDSSVRERVIVAMSGGVDSSVAAAILAGGDCEVIGITMHLAGERSRCCGIADVEDARRVAERLGVRFFVANYLDAFRREVIETFADEYLRGRTPIPCVACNSRFKFEHLLDRAHVLGAQRVATGHYARIDRDSESGRLRLRTAVDTSKDQTYFLFQLTQAQLERAEFPLGALDKQSVRERARELGLVTADKPESQEICFVPDGDYAAVVERIRPEARERGGEIVDVSGKVLGRHQGVHRFTVGQRRGLGIASNRALYVVRIEAARRQVVVGEVDALNAPVAELDGVSWISGETPGASVRARVKVRYRDVGTEAVVEAQDGARARVVFDQPVRAITPGQAAVFYDNDVVLGGGWISGASS